MINRIAVMIGLLSVIATAVGQTPRAAKATSSRAVHLADLVAQNKVEVIADGKAIDTMIVRLRKRVPGGMLVRIPAGAYWVARDTKTQNLVTTKSKSVTLDEVTWKIVELDVACANMKRQIPGDNDKYDPGPDVVLLRQLAPQLEKLHSFTARQTAVWIVTDNASDSQLGSLSWGPYGPRAISGYDTASGMKAIVEAGIDIHSREIWNDRGAILGRLGSEMAHRGSVWLAPNEVLEAQRLRDWLLADYKKDIPGDLVSASPSRRANAVWAYLEFGFPEPFEHLLPLLRDSSSSSRVAAAEALGRLGDPRAVEPLIEYLNHDLSSDSYSPSEDGAVARALGKLRDHRAIPVLKKTLKFGTHGRRDPDGIRSAVWALGEIGDPSAVPALLDVTSKPNYADYEREISPDLAQALIKLGATDEMLKIVKDEPFRHTEALGMCRDPRCEDFLIGLLKDPHTAKNAAEALAQNGSARAVAPLIRAFSLPMDGSPYIEERQKAFASTLGQITGKNFGVNPARWRLWLKSGATR